MQCSADTRNSNIKLSDHESKAGKTSFICKINKFISNIEASFRKKNRFKQFSRAVVVCIWHVPAWHIVLMHYVSIQCAGCN